MKPEQMYRQLKEVAEKLKLTVADHSFKNTGILVRSGLCKVRGKNIFIMDKNLPIRKKVRILAKCLSQMPHEGIYLVPAVRDLLAEFENEKDEKA